MSVKLSAQTLSARWRMLAIAVATVLLVTGLPLARNARAAGPATYYVAPNGSDSNPGTQQKPFGTVENALKRLNAGDTLLLRGGVYAERVTAGKLHAGTSGAPITVKNAPGERPVIQGLFWLTSPDYWHISGVNVTWGSGNSSSEHMVKFSGGTGWSYSDSEVWGAHSYAGVIVTGGAQQWSLNHLYVHDTYASNGDNQDHLIYVSEGFNGVIEHNLLVNSPNGRGVKLARPSAGDGAPAGVIVRYNTFVNNAGANASSSYDAHDNQIYGNIMVNSGNGARQNVMALSLSGSNVVVKNNVGWQSSGLIEQGAGLVDGGGNRMLDPQLDGNYKPTNRALLDANGNPLYGSMATGGAPTPTTQPTPTATPQPQPSATPSPSPSATPSPAPSATPSPAPSATPSPAPSATPSPSPTQTRPTLRTRPTRMTRRVLINDTFSSNAVGQVPAGWFDAHAGGGGTLSVAPAPSLTQKSLKATDTQTVGDVRPSKQFEPVTNGQIVAQVDVMVSAMPRNSAIYIASLMSGGEFASSVSLSKSGTFMYFNGATAVDTGIAYQAGVWYRVTESLDIATRTYNLQIQQVGVVRPLVAVVGQSWRSAVATNVDRIRFDTSDGEVGLSLYIDNVVVVAQ